MGRGSGIACKWRICYAGLRHIMGERKAGLDGEKREVNEIHDIE